MGSVGAAVPVPRVRFITFDPVEMGVHPIASLIALRLREPVCFRPVSLRLMPERLERGREIFWRRIPV